MWIQAIAAESLQALPSAYCVLVTVKWGIWYWTNRQNPCSYRAHFLVGKPDAISDIKYNVRVWWVLQRKIKQIIYGKMRRRKEGREGGKKNIVCFHLPVFLYRVSWMLYLPLRFFCLVIWYFPLASKLQEAGTMTLCIPLAPLTLYIFNSNAPFFSKPSVLLGCQEILIYSKLLAMTKMWTKSLICSFFPCYGHFPLLIL